MSLKTQAKVLRVLQEQVDRARRRHSSASASTCACSRRPTRTWPPRFAQGRFREDLYFRLNVIPIFVPPLRDRGDDMSVLARALHGGVRARSTAAGRSASSPQAVARLQQLSVAGQRARAAQHDRAADDHGAGRHHRRRRTWPFSIATVRRRRRAAAAASAGPLSEARDAFERDYILRTLRWPRRATSRARPRCSGVERSNLYKKMRALRHRARARTRRSDVATANVKRRRNARSSSQLRFEHLVVGEAVELQVVLGRMRSAPPPAPARRSRSRAPCTP